MKLLVLVFLVGGCLCTEPRRDTTSVCVEMHGAQGRDEHGRQGIYQPPFQQQYQGGTTQQGMHAPGMPQQGMHPQGMPQHGMHPQGMPQQGMHPQGMPQQGMSPHGMPQQGMHPPGMPQQGMPPHGMPPMFIPPQFRGRLPPMPNPIMIIKRLEEECAAKDQQIAELKSILNQQHELPPKQEYHHQQLPPPQHRQPEH